ncbi:MAG: ligase-associated DNA damage response endonuclease PdeM [Neomegalonema sp.]|nr:ligase-associated DNA damage response endonuclease PdeM [Neomegalonema sp.]
MHDRSACGAWVSLGEAQLLLHRSGALWWPDQRLLCVSDLHLGKAERVARRGGPLLPPYADADTLGRLAALIAHFDPGIVISLGDSFDDDCAASSLGAAERVQLERMMTQRRWVWIVGNHDPGAGNHAGEIAASWSRLGLRFRHEARLAASLSGAGTEKTCLESDGAEVSGHFHPKCSLSVAGRQISRRCFLLGGGRLILPAFGTFTGGLEAKSETLRRFLPDDTEAFMIGERVIRLPAFASAQIREKSR